MSLEAAFYSRLTGHAGLSALVGTRIYPKQAPQGATEPYITYSLISTADRVSAMGSDTGNVSSLYQFDIWDADELTAINVAKQLRLALQRWRNSSGTVVDDTFVAGERSGFDKETSTHRRIMDFRFKYRE